MLSKTPRLLHLSIALDHIHIYDLNLSWKCRIHAGRWPFALGEKYSSNIFFSISHSRKYNCTSDRSAFNKTKIYTFRFIIKYIVTTILYYEIKNIRLYLHYFIYLWFFIYYITTVRKLLFKYNSKNEESN